MIRKYAALAALGLLCAACVQEPSKDPEWYGTVSRAYGPADGPAIRITLDTVP